ncbi:MAG: extracellular solute-binding protein [Gammaproteobacteria bacterium]
MPFAVSTPILYLNADLFKAAGLDVSKPPKTWPEVIAAAKAIQKADSGATGLFFDYLITGNWGFQALLAGEGGTMMDDTEKRVTFADERGKRAAKILRSFIDAGVMKDWSRRQGEQSFIAGRVGIYVSSTSWLKGVDEKDGLRSAHGALSGGLHRKASGTRRWQCRDDHYQGPGQSTRRV